MTKESRPDFHILLVEDNEADVRLAKEALKEAMVQNNLHTARSGDEALAFLRKQGDFQDVPTPDLVLLDLNMPGKSGHEVLEEIKGDRLLASIPVVVLTTSSSKEDIARAYAAHANSYVVKPKRLDRFIDVMLGIQDHWMGVVRLPPRDK